MTTYTSGQKLFVPEPLGTIFVDDAVAAPGAGNNATIVPAAGYLYKWLAIHVTLTTGPAVQNRRVFVELSNAPHLVNRVYANQIVPAARTGEFFFMVGYPGDLLVLDSTNVRWINAPLPFEWESVAPYGVVVGMEDNTVNDVLYNIRFQALSYRV